MKMTEQRKNNFGAWLKVCLAVFAPGLLLILLGFIYLSQINREVALQNFENLASEKLEELTLLADSEKYICSEFTRIFAAAEDPDELKKRVEEFSQEHKLDFKYLIWNKSGEIPHSTFDYRAIEADWNRAYFDLYDFYKKKYLSEAMVPPDVYENLRKVFGPHFFPRYFYRSYLSRELHLLHNDSAKQRPLLWLRVTKKFGLALFFSYGVFDSSVGVKKMLRDSKKERLKMAAVIDGEVFSSDDRISRLIKADLPGFTRSYRNVFRANGYFVVSQYVNEKIVGLCLVQNDEMRHDLVPLWAWLAVFALVLVLLTMMLKSYRIMVMGQSFSLSIRRQLLALFLFSIALPGFVMAVLASDYLAQFRQGLLNEAYSEGVAHLQSIDELFENEKTFQRNRLEKGFIRLEKSLKKKGIDGRVIRKFLKSQRPEPYRLFLVGSATQYLASNEVVLKNGKVLDLIDKDYYRGPHKAQQLKALEKIGRFFLATINNQPISSKMGTEVEMLTESLSQQSPTQLMQEFIASDGRFWSWGIGSKVHPAFVKLFSLFEPGIYDYMFLYLWSDYDMQKNFMKRQFQKFSRNRLGVKVMALDFHANKTLPPELVHNQKLREFANRLKDRSGKRLEYCEYEGQTYLLFGFKCNLLSDFRLLGLFPVDKIDRQVQRKTGLFYGFAFLSLLITISLGMFVARSVIEPLSELQEGIEALKQRKFSYRLPDLGGDEFGKLARIFNDTLVDFQEMDTASDVKARLMTPALTPFNAGRFAVMGSTMAFAQMGGDFLEITDRQNDCAGIAIGDIAGSGIASTLILAFFKSALIQLDDLHGQPEKLVHELNRLMVVSSRKDHRKFMAFQYCFVDGKTGQINICNAGMFYPVIVSALNRQIRQIEMPSPPLGSSGNYERKSVLVELKEDEYLIMLSNGVLAGGRIDHAEIHKVIAGSDLSSVESLHKSFFARFRLEFADRNPDDDVTMAIIKNIPQKGDKNGPEPG
jgi:HAMP domain-containing protein